MGNRRRAVFGFVAALGLIGWIQSIGPRSAAAQLAFSTYLGGSNADSTRDVATDAAGNIYVTGGTEGSGFPATAGAYDTTFNGTHDVYVAKFTPQGSLIWATYVGGPFYDRGYALEVGADQTVYVAGRGGGGFPVTPGAFQTQFQGGGTGIYGEQDAFVLKLSADGATLLWASYFGVPNYEDAFRDLAVDSDGDVYLATGHQFSGVYTPAVTAAFAGSYRSTPVAGTDGVLAKVRSDGSQVLWATYIGGTQSDGGTPSVCVGSDKRPVYLGYTTSGDLPVTPGAFDLTYGGGGDVFVAKFSPDGSDLLFCSFLGGSAVEFTETHGLALGPDGVIYVAASTESSNLPTTSGAFQTAYGGTGGPGLGQGTNYPGDVFVSKISADGAQLLASTYLGGSAGEGAEGVFVDRKGNVCVSGTTYSANFPRTADAQQAAIGGQSDFFAVKLSSNLSQLVYGSFLGGSLQDDGRCATADPAGNLIVGGLIASTNWPVLNAAYPTYRGGVSDGALAKFQLARITKAGDWKSYR